MKITTKFPRRAGQKYITSLGTISFDDNCVAEIADNITIEAVQNVMPDVILVVDAPPASSMTTNELLSKLKDMKVADLKDTANNLEGADPSAIDKMNKTHLIEYITDYFNKESE